MSKRHRCGRRVVHIREGFLERRQFRQQAQQGFGGRRLNDQLVALSSDDRILSRQLEFSRNPYGLVAPVLEQLDVPKSIHALKLAYADGICQTAPDITRWRRQRPRRPYRPVTDNHDLIAPTIAVTMPPLGKPTSAL